MSATSILETNAKNCRWFPYCPSLVQSQGSPLTFWHVRFHQTNLPEKLVSGRQAEYFRYFLSQFSDVDVDHYAHAYRDPDLQKVFDHRGIVLNQPIGALAHLGLARAYTLSGDTAKAKTAYQNFLVLWKDADLDLLILQQAKAEYAKLQ